MLKEEELLQRCIGRSSKSNFRRFSTKIQSSCTTTHLSTLRNAVREFRAELEAHPGDAKAKYHLAYGLLMEQQKDQAFTLLSEVVRDKPDYADAQYQLGKILLERGEVKGRD